MTDFLFEYDNSTFSAFDTKIGSVVYSLISYSRSTSVRFVADAGTVDLFFFTVGAAPAFGT